MSTLRADVACGGGKRIVWHRLDGIGIEVFALRPWNRRSASMGVDGSASLRFTSPSAHLHDDGFKACGFLGQTMRSKACRLAAREALFLARRRSGASAPQGWRRPGRAHA